MTIPINVPHSFAAAFIKSDLVKVSKVNSTIQTKNMKLGPDPVWENYEKIGFIRLYYVMRVIEKHPKHDSIWGEFRVRLAAFGIYRDIKSCKDHVSTY